ncbi:ROK family transcriptional regulator [Alterisphingorhabdus coralli]|uniref:ROK family protein n=1 Tax=Alterisphingorhabdus coralli TaxID=3071408 RepID=A0AA97HZX2_9SPHN|nr:ROK family protein [Parasphingorhabdus sp. SCSIO 66989]WOE75199.1 ROK family protein [Parasphingorhabdus sp. SCSIO 66989]
MALSLKLNESHRRVLRLIRQHQPVTRAALGKISGLGSGPITQLTRDLLLAGLIGEGERIRGGRGQPALPLKLEPGGALSFGVAMSPGRIRIVAVDFTGALVDDHIADMPSNGPESVAMLVQEHIDQISRKVRLFDADRILGLGFAVPGYFFADHEHMRLVDEHASWRDINLTAYFSEALNLPCFMENDATAAALAEYYHAPSETRCLITLLINYGIGGGLVLEGRPFRGGHGNAGEIGAFFPLDKARPSGTDLLGFMAERGLELPSLETMNWGDSDQAAMGAQWAERAGPQLAELVESAWSWFDPDSIHLSGALPTELLEALVSAMDAPSLFGSFSERPAPKLHASSLGSAVTAMGAAYLPLHEFSGQLE